MDFNNDPRLTAYALGEMIDAERTAFEAELAANPAAETATRSAIESIRALAAGLASELREEMNAKPIVPAAKVERRSRLLPRVVLAAAASVVVGGLAFAILTPSLNRAREVAHVDPGRLGNAAVPDNLNSNAATAIAVDAAKQSSQVGYRLDLSSTLPTAGPLSAQGLIAGKLVVIDRAVAAIDLFGVGQQGQSNDESLLYTRLMASDAIRSPSNLAQANGPQLQTVLRQAEMAGSTESLARLRADRAELEAQRGVMSKINRDLVDVLNTPDSSGEKLKTFRVPADQIVDSRSSESYAKLNDNPFRDVYAAPLSTFGVDVDTASYSNIRRYLDAGSKPPADAVRIEELINYFPTRDAPPTDGKPFAVHMEVADCPWQPAHRLVRIALKGKEVAKDKRPPANLTFLIDVSGSMDEPNKLPLVKRSLRKLVGQLGENDHVAMVVYAGNSGLVLPMTSANDKATILKAIDNLEAGGSTNGGQGIELAYATAMPRSADDRRGDPVNNRVILCTDGDFNVGITDRSALFEMIAQKAKAGIFLNVLGFGTGNIKDDTMEGLADKGNGQYGYIDSDREADKVFVEQVAGTLQTIAKDVKLQLEFNPATVKSYRLIGYENRVLKTEDFNNDLKDSGDMGAGHSVVALYEVEPMHPEFPRGPVPAETELKYQPKTAGPAPIAKDANTSELLTLKLRYKKPDAPLEQGTSELIETALADRTDAAMSSASEDFRFDASVAAFGMMLRESPHRASASWEMIRGLARGAVGDDAGGHRSEFLNLIDQAQKARP